MTAQQDAYKIDIIYMLIPTAKIQENEGKSPIQVVTFMNNQIL